MYLVRPFQPIISPRYQPLGNDRFFEELTCTFNPEADHGLFAKRPLTTGRQLFVDNRHPASTPNLDVSLFRNLQRIIHLNA